MRIYISADIEGIVGVASYDQTEPGGFEYETARRWMTRSVVAAAAAAHTCGAQEVVISDSHGNAQNLLLDELPPYCRLVRSWPRPLAMMQGIERGRYDGVFLIGYHGGSESARGVITHTLSGAIQRLRVNDVAVDETVLAAAVAGEHGAPVLMVSGDDAYVEQARAALGDVEAAVVKDALGRQSVLTVTPEQALQRLRDAATRALRRGDIAPFSGLAAPLDVRLELRSPLQAEVLAWLPMFERTGAHELRFRCTSVTELTRWLAFIGDYDLSKF
jgi:D-amino peptidase